MPADVAVLMSVYDGTPSGMTQLAIDSILQQTYADFDLYLMLDGPQDPGLREVLAAIRDSRLIVVSRAEHQGLSRTLNGLISLALPKRYRYYARMDADDISLAPRFEKQLRFLDANPTVDILGSCAVEIDDRGMEVGRIRKPAENTEIRRGLARHNPFVHSSVMMRARVFDEGHRYPDDYHLNEDYAFWVSLQQAGYECANLPDALLQFRRGSGFAARRHGLRPACAEFRVRYQALRLPGAFSGLAAGLTAVTFVCKVLPTPILRLAYSMHRRLESTFI